MTAARVTRLSTARQQSAGVRGAGESLRGQPLDRLLLPVRAIQPNPANPRHLFDERALDALADSIRAWGQLQPVVVRPMDAGYLLVCGERRWRAHLRAGLETIWAIVRDVAESDALAVALAENLQRVDLSHAEKVAALDQLAELAQARGLRKTATQLGVDPSWLSRQLSVRRDPVIFPALEAGSIGFGQAAELLRAPKQARTALVARAIESVPPASTATIRAWVEASRRESIEYPSGPSPYRSVLTKLDRLGAPQSNDDLAALRELVNTAQRLLRAGTTPTPAVPASDKHTTVELRCLLCGEEAGWVVDGRHLYPRHVGSLQRAGGQLQCGRCGGKLTACEQTEQYFYTH